MKIVKMAVLPSLIKQITPKDWWMKNESLYRLIIQLFIAILFLWQLYENNKLHEFDIKEFLKILIL